MELPTIGSWVEVTTDYSSVMGGFAFATSRTHTQVGKVIEKDEWEDDDVFCIMTNDAKMPVRSIKMKYVSKLRYLDSNTDLNVGVAKNEEKAQEVVNFEVKGSKGNTYIVTKNGFSWSCTCPAGEFKRHCKHVVEAKARYEAVQA